MYSGLLLEMLDVKQVAMKCFLIPLQEDLVWVILILRL